MPFLEERGLVLRGSTEDMTEESFFFMFMVCIGGGMEGFFQW
jgi:hypothetical protein